MCGLLVVLTHAMVVWKSTMMDSEVQFVMTSLISMTLKSSVVNWATELLHHITVLIMVKALYQYFWTTCNVLVVKIRLTPAVGMAGVCTTVVTMKMPVLIVPEYLQYSKRP